MPRLARFAPIAQGVYYVATGLWSLVSIGTFERVTGPKVDRWLVKTVGVLVTVDGAVLLAAAARRRLTPEVALLGAGSALGLAAIDTVYALRGRISPVYLLDAVAEVVLASGVAAKGRESKGERRESKGERRGGGLPFRGRVRDGGMSRPVTRRPID